MKNLLQIVLLSLISVVTAEEGYYNDDANQYNYNGDDAADKYYYANMHQDDNSFSAGDDYIKYWTEYAILPKRCIV